MRVLYCGTGWPDAPELVRARLPESFEVRVWDPTRPLVDQVGGMNILLPSNTYVGDAEMAACPGLELLQQPAAGYDTVDIEAARRRGVPVCNAPGQNAETVAEAALLLILALARRLPAASRAFAARRIGEPAGMELRGKTLGVVGLGRTGSHLASVARAMGMEVLAVRSSSSREDLDELLARSDVVSLHCPLTERTRSLVDGAAFSAMKPGALLVNCARGAIVDRDALVAALEAGRLGGFGADVHWSEPPDPEDPLYARSDVVALPHVAGATRESLGRIADVVAENILRVARGEELLHRVA